MPRAYDFLRQHMKTVRRQVDITNARLLESTDWLTPYAPFMSYVDYDLLLLKLKKNKAIAHIVGLEGEIPESSHGSIQTAELSVIKIGKSYVYTENDMMLLRKWQENVRGVPDQVRDYFFGSVTDLMPANQATHTLLWLMANRTGQIDYLDDVTNIRTRTLYVDDPQQYPPALTATPDANNSVAWTDQVNATPVADFVRHSRTYRNVALPDATMMNLASYDTMVDTAEFRQQVTARRNVDASTANSFKVSEADAQEVFEVNKIPPLSVIDGTYETEYPDGSTTEHFWIPEGEYMFGWRGNGERATGPVESNNGQPGVHTFTEEVSQEPPIDRSVGVSTGAPMFFDTRRMGGRVVYAA